ncbi:aldehyde dehydrogenase family protein [[Mycobacterium] vasticus]|uniref:Aldehyde dehydrogenase family protein n=1 Tax=[Mycobacterium] vasticus TaxID=2875777 RepID=A0ABU5YZZ9_9MYCO|nr:aldehyde dehydrogenase family protein [Mycolicibacter sp. MYC017]MEB3070698.1 aldehyde dehydrogenase family protein [Mycolicibacter sp. MYC017]
MSVSPHYRLFIDGQWTDGEADSVVEVINPASEAVIGSAVQATEKDVARAIESARGAFDDGPWPRMTPRQRSDILLRMADIMDRRRSELIDLNIAEAGSTRALAEFLQVGIPLEHFRDTADRVLMRFPFEQPMLPITGMGLGQGVVLKEPAGVAALISAYNFPLFLNLFKSAPALAAGCTAVLKPAPGTPLEAFVLAEIAEEAELPPGVLNVVTGDIEAGRQLTTHPAVDVVSFTGSDAVGRLVASQASSTVKKVILELGGKSANIVCEDADLSKVLPSVIENMITHAGQGCALLTRTLVHRSRHEELVAMIVAALSHISIGDPADPSIMMGPLISAAQRDKVESLIATGVSEGAQIAFGGERPAGLDTGFFVQPTLLTGVDNDMAVAQREFFGPVGVVIPFDDDADAVRLANASDYGLAGGVWARDPLRAYGIARQIRAGLVGVNGGGPGLSPHGPFGGYKQSGLGREWGAFGLEEFTEAKTVHWPIAAG